MAKLADLVADSQLNQKCDQFVDKMNSNMHFKSEFAGDTLSFEWIDAVENSCPYLDNIIRNPKLALIKEEEVVKIEKAKKIGVASVKNLSTHTHYIDEVDEVTDEVRPSNILIEFSEETFNTYENRFLYTLISILTRFILKQEEKLDNLELKDDKVLEYAASTKAGGEKINVELKITSNTQPDEVLDKETEDEINQIRSRMNRIKKFIGSWQRSEMFIALDKAHVPLVIPPIKRTNLILKNPNFQVATKLWELLQSYTMDANDDSKDNLDTKGDKLLLSILDDSFLMNYFVLDSIDKSKRKQKSRVGEYAIIMIRQQIKRAVALLLNNGFKVTEQDILDLVASEIKNEKDKSIVDGAEIKNKFKAELEEYLNKSQNYL